MMQHISRRSLLASPLILGGLGAAVNALAQTEAKPHFFLQIMIEDGVDSLYLFDSRPKIFTAAGLIANYAKDEAILWEGAAGGRCWSSSFMQKLKPFKNRLAILNGVMMPLGFEGHDQNVNSALTANPFGGNYFGALVGGADLALPFLGLGRFFSVTLSNRSKALVLDSKTANLLAENAAKKTQEKPGAWRQLIRDRSQNCSQGTGAFSSGCAAFADSLDRSQTLAANLAGTGVVFEENASDLAKRTAVAISYFKNKMTRSAVIDFSPPYAMDSHAPKDAMNAADAFEKLSSDILASLKLLQDTPFDAANGLSMLDVTTVMISSEFSRTHMQSGKTVETTGTDHNTLGNMVLLCGKGIRGDLVVGATDLDALTEDGKFKRISPAHKILDAQNYKRMAKVFDFDKQMVSEALPETFKIDDYISIPSVMNTILSVFGISSKLWISNDTRTSVATKPAAIVSQVLLT